MPCAMSRGYAEFEFKVQASVSHLCSGLVCKKRGGGRVGLMLILHETM